SICSKAYLAFLNFPSVAPVFCFFFAGPFVSGSYNKNKSNLEPVTVKKESSLPCVLPCLLFTIFLQPLRILSSLVCKKLFHLNCFSLHINWTRPSSSGSFHFSSTEEQSTTSGFRNRPLASLYSQSSGAEISSMQPCCRIRSTALLGPIPLMVPQ
uniref:Uncharacterized protein n=1 Tax=Oryzias latipes TaxID=8090 RepID=A0A3P9GZW7_ORYLA